MLKPQTNNAVNTVKVKFATKKKKNLKKQNSLSDAQPTPWRLKQKSSRGMYRTDRARMASATHTLCVEPQTEPHLALCTFRFAFSAPIDSRASLPAAIIANRQSPSQTKPKSNPCIEAVRRRAPMLLH